MNQRYAGEFSKLKYVVHEIVWHTSHRRIRSRYPIESNLSIETAERKSIGFYTKDFHSPRRTRSTAGAAVKDFISRRQTIN